MSNFKIFLNETSLSRVYAHTQGKNVGIISAFRGGEERTPAQNEAAHRELGEKIRSAGFGRIRVQGHYIEDKGSLNARPVYEKSWLVIGKDGPDSGNLLGNMKKWGREYNQDSVLYKPHDQRNAALHGTKEDVWPGAGNAENVGEWHPNRTSEFLTLIRGKKGPTFTFAQDEPIREEYLGIQFISGKSFFNRTEHDF